MKKIINLLLALFMVLSSQLLTAQEIDNTQIVITAGKPSNVFDANELSAGIGMLIENKALLEFSFNIKSKCNTRTNKEYLDINPSVNLGYNILLDKNNHSLIPFTGIILHNGGIDKKVKLNYGLLIKSNISKRTSLYYGYSDFEKLRVGLGFSFNK